MNFKLEFEKLAQDLADAKPLVDVFHAHLDVCAQCRNQPFNLCPEGSKRLHEAVLGRPSK